MILSILQFFLNKIRQALTIRSFVYLLTSSGTHSNNEVCENNGHEFFGEYALLVSS
jgi:hypothetical protein